MKKRSILVMMALLAVIVATLVGCAKEYTLRVSTQNLWFGLDAGTQTIELTANCKWTIRQNEEVETEKTSVLIKMCTFAPEIKHKHNEKKH